MTEKIFIVPLRNKWLKKSRVKRTNRALSSLREFVKKNTKAENVKISEKVNEKIWLRGAKKPLSKIKIKVKIDENIAFVRLPDEKEHIKKEEKKGRFEVLKEKAGIKEKEVKHADKKEKNKEEPKKEEISKI